MIWQKLLRKNQQAVGKELGLRSEATVYLSISQFMQTSGLHNHSF